MSPRSGSMYVTAPAYTMMTPNRGTVHFEVSSVHKRQDKYLFRLFVYTLYDRHVRRVVIPPSHRRRGATAVRARHKPQCHRHDRRGSAVVSSMIAVKPRQIVKRADIISPSHRGRGATAVFIRHKPQWYRHDRRGSAEVPSLIAVVPRKTVNIANLRGGTAATLNMFKTSVLPPLVGPIRSGIAEAPPLPLRPFCFRLTLLHKQLSVVQDSTTTTGHVGDMQVC